MDVAPAGKPDPKAVEFYPQEQFETNLKSWRTVIELKRMTAENVIARAEAKHPLTDEQKEEIRKLEQIAEPQDRKRVVEGKSVSVHVAIGGSRIIKTKQVNEIYTNIIHH